MIQTRRGAAHLWVTGLIAEGGSKDLHGREWNESHADRVAGATRRSWAAIYEGPGPSGQSAEAAPRGPAGAARLRWVAGVLLVLKHMRNWSLRACWNGKEVRRANLVYIATSPGWGGKPRWPDAKTMGRWGSVRSGGRVGGQNRSMNGSLQDRARPSGWRKAGGCAVDNHGGRDQHSLPPPDSSLFGATGCGGC